MNTHKYTVVMYKPDSGHYDYELFNSECMINTNQNYEETLELAVRYLTMFPTGKWEKGWEVKVISEDGSIWDSEYSEPNRITPADLPAAQDPSIMNEFIALTNEINLQYSTAKSKYDAEKKAEEDRKAAEYKARVEAQERRQFNELFAKYGLK